MYIFSGSKSTSVPNFKWLCVSIPELLNVFEDPAEHVHTYYSIGVKYYRTTTYRIGCVITVEQQGNNSSWIRILCLEMASCTVALIDKLIKCIIIKTHGSEACGQWNCKAHAHKYACGYYCELFTCSDSFIIMGLLLSLTLYCQVQAAPKLVWSFCSSNLTSRQ